MIYYQRSNMNIQEKKSVIEALLFVAGEPVALSTIKSATEIPEAEIKQILDGLVADYKERNGGLSIVEIANGYRMVTSPGCSQWIRRFMNTNTSSKLSMAALETLAIVAYNQPVIKAEIEQIRGVNSDGVMKTLLERRLIKIMGRKEMPGRPLLYGTTREFLQYFGLKDLTELPTIKELNREEAA